MRIGIVGANGQVGTELVPLLEAAGHDPVAIVRSKLASHFFDYHGYEYRVGDIGEPSDARGVLEGLDAVVVAAFASAFSRGEVRASAARRANERIVEHSVEYTAAGTPIIYLSSQAAFGDDLGAPQFDDYSFYTREKRHAESVLKKAAGKSDPWYALRLGHVFGPHQGISDEFKQALGKSNPRYVGADPSTPSNAVHTVTVCDAITTCAEEVPNSGIYTVVNRPQWSWGEVIEYYQPDGVAVEYDEDAVTASDPSIVDRVIGKAVGWASGHDQLIAFILTKVPDSVNERLYSVYSGEARSGEIEELRSQRRFEKDGFHFDPVPGEQISELEQTMDLLEADEALHIFR